MEFFYWLIQKSRWKSVLLLKIWKIHLLAMKFPCGRCFFNIYSYCFLVVIFFSWFYFQKGSIFCSLHDPAVEVASGYNDKNGVALWSRCGKTMVSFSVNIFLYFSSSSLSFSLFLFAIRKFLWEYVQQVICQIQFSIVYVK